MSCYRIRWKLVSHALPSRSIFSVPFSKMCPPVHLDNGGDSTSYARRLDLSMVGYASTPWQLGSRCGKVVGGADVQAPLRLARQGICLGKKKEKRVAAGGVLVARPSD